MLIDMGVLTTDILFTCANTQHLSACVLFGHYQELIGRWKASECAMLGNVVVDAKNQSVVNFVRTLYHCLRHLSCPNTRECRRNISIPSGPVCVVGYATRRYRET